MKELMKKCCELCVLENMHFYRVPIFIILLCLPRGFTDHISLMSSPKDDFCITNSSSAMYYKTRTGKLRTEGIEFLPVNYYYCDFENEQCSKTFMVDPWEMAYSLNHENPPLLDYRWERLLVQKLPYKGNGEQLKFETLLELHDQKYFKIPISLLGEEVHLLLCDRKDVENANCYWFALQGWNRKFSGMRRCNSGEIRGLYPQGECKNRTEETSHPQDFPLFIDNQWWSHVILERNKNDLYLKSYHAGGEAKIIHFSEEKEMFEMKYLLGHRKKEDVLCKVHENHYMLSTSTSEKLFANWLSNRDNGFCVSMFVKTCPHCSMYVSFMAENNILISKYLIESTKGIWKEHQMKSYNSTHKFMAVSIKTQVTEGYATTGSEYWAFDDIRQCNKKQYRVTPRIDPYQISECRLVGYNQSVVMNKTVKYDPEVNCTSTGSIGRLCVSCSILQQSHWASCKNLKICEKVDGANLCYCSPGSLGPTCDTDCSDGHYGYSCKKECGFCVNKCNSSDGTCICNHFFEAPTCKMPIQHHYLSKAPKVINSTTQSCEIKWNVEDIIGKTRAKYYISQYTDNLEFPSWKDYGVVQEISSEHVKTSIGNLKKWQNYGIRVLVSDEESKIKILHSVNLPISKCQTCSGWNEKNIHVDATSNSALVVLQLTEDECDFSMYVWNLEDETGEILIGNATISGARFRISELIPFKNYKIVLISSSEKISKNFKTLEEVPSVVRDIRMEESTASYMKLTWIVPANPGGQIQKYNVKYQKLRRSSCLSNSPLRILERNTTSNSIELNDLEPYSEYKVTISAINTVKVGENASLFCRTQGLDYFKDEENLNSLTIRVESLQTAASFIFENIQCEKLLGPVKLMTKCRCISSWCMSTKAGSEFLESFQGTQKLRNLQPYCKYNCNISFCRNEICKFYGNRTFETKPGAPNALEDFAVTAMGDSFIWIRWLPPYPPTGRVQVYRITTKCQDCRYSHENSFYPNLVKCSIWPDYFCFKIQDFIYYDFEASILIEAANTENYKYNQVGHEIIRVREKPSEAPYNVSVIVDVDNNVEIFMNHPNRTNGVFEGFSIEINNSIISSQWNYTPPVSRTYHIQFRISFPPAADFHITLMAVNNRYIGEPALINGTTYPVIPELMDSNIHITKYTKTAISISVNTTKIKESNSNVREMLIVLITDHETNKDTNLEIIEKKINISLDRGIALRVVAVQDLRKQSSNIFNFTIGDGNEITETSFLDLKITNEPLQQSQYYNISIILLNEYKGKYRFEMYNTTSLTEGDPDISTPSQPKSSEKKKREESSGVNANYAFFLLLLLIPVIVGIIIKRKNLVTASSVLYLEPIARPPTQCEPYYEYVQ